MGKKGILIVAIAVALTITIMSIGSVSGLEDVPWICMTLVDDDIQTENVMSPTNPEQGETYCFPKEKNIGLPNEELIECSCEWENPWEIELLGETVSGRPSISSLVPNNRILAKDCGNINHGTCTEVEDSETPTPTPTPTHTQISTPATTPTETPTPTAMTSPVSAVEKVDLFFLVDGSKSIDFRDFGSQMDVLANAIKDPNVIPQDGNVSVCVILFGSGDAKVIVSPTTINSQSTANLVYETVKNQRQPGGGTPMAKAFDLAVENFPRDPSGRQVIDLSTDGKPDNERDTTNSRDAALKKGFDELNAIGVGLKPGGKEEQFLQNLTFPQPSTSDPGFYIAAADYKDFKAKMKDKIIKEVQRGPSSKQAAAAGALASAAVIVWAILNRLTNAGTSRKSRGKGGKAGPHDDSTLSGEGGATQQGPLAKDNLEPGTVDKSLDVSGKLMEEIEPFEKREGRKVGKGGIIGPKEPSSTEVLCPKCGKKNDRKARFCTNCGTSLVREDR